MTMQLKPGTRLYSAVCETELMTIRAPADPIAVTIGGVDPVLDAGERPGAGEVVEGHGGGSAMGKRYVDDAGTLELLCTKAGEGAPAVDGVLLGTKDAKALPASD